MRILFVADIHYALKQFDWLLARASEFDAVAIGGDLLDLSSALEFDVQIVVVENYLARLRARTRVLVCSGNHDGDHRNEANESVASWLQDVRAERLHVDCDHVELDGTLITICPWWDGPVSRAALEQLLEADAARPKSRWVWLHHAPPDRYRVSWTGRHFAGDAFVVDWIKRFRPDVVLSGHVHNAPFYAPNGSWIDRVEHTWVINPGRQIGPAPAFVAFDLGAMTAQWVSLQDEGVQDLAAG
jgi:Icc-related predicted phosphoesterase